MSWREIDEGGTYSHRLHALDVTTGKDISGSPVTISGSGFSSKEQLQRPALLLANGNVYISFGSEGDTTPWHGWIFAYRNRHAFASRHLEFFSEREWRRNLERRRRSGSRFQRQHLRLDRQRQLERNHPVQHELGKAQSDPECAGFLDPVQRVQPIEWRRRPRLRSSRADSELNPAALIRTS